METAGIFLPGHEERMCRKLENIRAAIFDVDGTLYDYRTHSVLPSTVEALERLRERGVRILLASGRSYTLLGASLVRLTRPDGYVLSNGHELLDGEGKPVCLERFTMEEVEGVLSAVREQGVHVMLKYHGFCCVYSGWKEMRAVFETLGLDEGDFRLCPDWDYHRQELPLGMTLRGGPRLREQLSAWEARLRIEYFHNPAECDVFHWNVNKWTGLRQVLARLGIRAEECVAFGDSGNDVDMLRAVGCGVAMGNASPDAAAAAARVCPPSWEDGIYSCLKELEII